MEREPERLYEFGEFVLNAHEKTLYIHSKAVDITPKALEILTILIEKAGRVVTKEEIIQRVWAQNFVEEANLTHHISRLRKILSESEEDRFVETLPKRGYRFIKAVRVVEPPPFHVANSEASGTTSRSRLISPVGAVLSDEKLRARPATANESGSNRGNLWLITVAPALILVILVTAAAFTLLKNDLQPKVLSPVRETKPEKSSPFTIKRVTDAGRYGASTISPDGKFVAFVQNSLGGEGMLYVRQIDTNREIELLEKGERNFGSISFSPDSSFIYFIQYEKASGGEGSLFRIPVLGGQPSKILKGVQFMFSLTPDGKGAVFYRFDAPGKKTSIVTAALDGRGDEQINLTLDDREKVISSSPAYSPDGRYISFAMADAERSNGSEPQFSLFTLDTTTSQIKPLTNEKWTEIGKTVWMPDASGLAFPGTRPKTGCQIYFLSFPESELRLLTNSLSTFGNYGMGVTADSSTLVVDIWESSAQIWSSDASGDTTKAEQITNGTSDGTIGIATLSDGSIVYSSRTGDEYDLWLLSSRGSRREGRPLTMDSYVESDVCTTPDDRYLIFASDRVGGKHHLFRTDLSGSDSLQLTSGDMDDASPECSVDGRTVFYSSTLGGETSLWKTSIDGGSPIKLTNYPCLSPAVSPDGKFAACIMPSDGFLSNATLAVISAELGGEPLKTFGIVPFGWFYRAPLWTPDGKGLVYAKSIRQIYNLWRQDIAGGEPKQFTDFTADVIFNFTFARDGKHLLISRGKVANNAVMLKNFK